MAHIGRVIAAARVEREISQSQLAAAAFMSGSSLSRLEHGLRKASMNDIQRLAAGLSVSADCLVKKAIELERTRNNEKDHAQPRNQR